MEYFLYNSEKFFQRKINCKIYHEQCELYVPLFARLNGQ